MKNTVDSLVFATNNAHKLAELRAIVGGRYNILSLSDIDCHEDIPETAPTLQGNAEQKARYIKEHYGYDCFADDTGLMVDALDGEPGVYSARYAGPGHDSKANMELLLHNMEHETNRKAHFSTVIALIQGDETRFFEGRVDGVILREPCGKDGFGYDPIFEPEGRGVSFAQMSADEKNAISHRGRAVAQLMDYLLNK
ncbi:MAG: non-canonical purine NTP diphosphatase [Paramuribaculum sp.]|nr:non-canonical purine NTP diphosphatase [Paramuribaculum sp.]